jgi:hypothetical protein
MADSGKEFLSVEVRQGTLLAIDDAASRCKPRVLRSAWVRQAILEKLMRSKSFRESDVGRQLGSPSPEAEVRQG